MFYNDSYIFLFEKETSETAKSFTTYKQVWLVNNIYLKDAICQVFTKSTVLISHLIADTQDIGMCRRWMY